MEISQCHFYGPAPESYTSWLDWIDQVQEGGDITGVVIFDAKQTYFTDAVDQAVRQKARSRELDKMRNNG